MKIRLTESQFKTISYYNKIAEDNGWNNIAEADIRYTPDMVNDALRSATKDLAEVKERYRSMLNYAAMLTVAEVSDNHGLYAKKHADFNQYKSIMNKRNGRYYDIANAFPYGEGDRNVSLLDKVASDMDTVLTDMEAVDDMLEGILGMSEKYIQLIKELGGI